MSNAILRYRPCPTRPHTLTHSQILYIRITHRKIIVSDDKRNGFFTIGSCSFSLSSTVPYNTNKKDYYLPTHSKLRNVHTCTTYVPIYIMCELGLSALIKAIAKFTEILCVKPKYIYFALI